MSLFSRLAKFAKRAVRKLAPIASVVAPFIPALGPLAGTILGAVTSRAATPGIAPEVLAGPRTMPGTGSVVTSVRRQRADRGAGVRARRASAAARRAPAPIPPGHTPLPSGAGVTRAAVVPAADRRMGIPRFAPGFQTRPTSGRRVIQLPPLGTTRTNQMSMFAALPALARVGQGVFRAATGRTAAAAGLGAAAGSLFSGGGAQGGPCPSGTHLNKQDGVGGPKGTYCVSNRRMNPGNGKAARRSVRRLKASRKLLRDIEKMMPSRPRARRAPAGHTERLSHT